MFIDNINIGNPDDCNKIGTGYDAFGR